MPRPIDTRTWTIGYYPMPARQPTTDKSLIEEARLFNHHAIADRLAELTSECVCNVGVQDCPEHPGRLKTQEQKIEFRKSWDRSVVEDA